MNPLRSIERLLYKPIDNSHIFYPPIDEEKFAYMTIAASADSSRVFCFPYFRSIEKINYIDVYVWDIMLPEGYKRFVLERGYALSEEDEEIFLKYFHENILVDNILYEYLVRRVREEYQGIHLECYADWRQTLLHMYYTLHRSGPYEILYKANLNFLADGLACVNEYNLIGSSPEKIFDVPLGMLRAMNSPYGLEIMTSADNRKWARFLYSKYHNLIWGTTINKYQWRYMKEQEECANTVDKKMYRFLGELSCDRNYYTYLKYMEQKQIVDDYYSELPQYPDEKALDEYCEACDMIEWYIEHEGYIDNRLRDKERKYRDAYSCETDEYIVRMPLSLRELLSEAQNQHNCLYRYVLRMACNASIILFMREKGREQDSLISIEVENGVIKQALRAYNRAPSEKQKRFLEEYARVKNLVLRIEGYFDWDDED